MGLLNVETLHKTAADSDVPVQGEQWFIFFDGTQQLCPLFENAELTQSTANPMVADESGRFDLCYLMDGSYSAVMADGQGVPLIDAVRVTISSPLSLGAVQTFQTQGELRADSLMRYDPDGLGVVVQPGTLISVAEGHFSYKVVPAEASFYHCTTANGVKLCVLPDSGGRFNALAFGADPTGVEDSWDAIQKCIDASYLGNQLGGMQSGIAYLPAGQYRVSNTVHVGYGLNSAAGDDVSIAFQSVIFEGAGESNNGSVHARGTTIIADFSDRPALNIQGGRASVVRRMTIRGVLVDWFKQNLLGKETTRVDTFNPDNWTDTATYPGTADSQHAPYAGVSIDAFSGQRPMEGYPDMIYPQYLGEVVQYSKNFSSRVTLEDLEITGFNTGIAQQPCDADGNADFSGFHRLRIKRNKYGISIGNSQSRTITGSQLIFASLYCAFTNNKHGRQSGTLGGVINGCAFDSIINLIEFSGTGQPGGVGPTKFQGFHAENIWRIGEVSGGGGPNDARVVFEQGNMSFGLQGESLGVPLSILSGKEGEGLQGSASIHFSGVQFQGFPTHMMFDCFPEALSFESCQFSGKSDLTQPYQWSAHNASMGGVLLLNAGNMGVGNENKRARFVECRVKSYDLSTGETTKFKIGPRDYRSRTYGVSPYCDQIGPQNFRLTKDLLDSAANKFNEKAVVSTALSGRIWSFVFNSRSEADFMHHGPLPGDILIDRRSGFAFAVRSREGDGVTAEMLNGFAPDGSMLPVGQRGTGVYQPFDPADFECFTLNSRYYALQKPIWGDTITSSTLVSGCGDDDCSSTQLEAALVVGDYLAINRDEFRPFTESSSVVVERSNADKTVTFSGGARYGRRIPIVQMIRQPVPNAT